MSRFMAGAVFAIALVVVVEFARGEDEEPSQTVSSSIVTRSLTLVDEKGRKRAVFETVPGPNDSVQLQLLDTNGEARLTLLQRDDFGGAIYVYGKRRDGGPIFSFGEYRDDTREVSGGALKVSGVHDGKRYWTALSPQRVQFWDEERLRHVFPSFARPKEGK